jgi:carboxylate/amino acid/amine transporter
MVSLLSTSLLWAFSFGLIKHNLAHVDPRFVALARLALAALLFLPGLRWRQVPLRVKGELCLLGAVQFGVMYLLYLFAFRTLQAYEIALLTITTPIWVCLADDLVRLRFSSRPMLAAMLAMVGTAIVLFGRELHHTPWRGILLVQASNACFAVGQILYRRRRPREYEFNERAIFGWLYIGAVLVVLPFAVATLPDALAHLTAREFAVIVYLGVVASGLGFFLWNHGATRVSAPVLAVMNNVKTPLGVLVSLLFFAESVQLTRLILGSAAILLAAMYAEHKTPNPGRSD